MADRRALSVWRDTGLVHALVGALSHEQLDRLAKEVRGEPFVVVHRRHFRG